MPIPQNPHVRQQALVMQTFGQPDCTSSIHARGLSNMFFVPHVRKKKECQHQSLSTCPTAKLTCRQRQRYYHSEAKLVSDYTEQLHVLLISECQPHRCSATHAGLSMQNSLHPPAEWCGCGFTSPHRADCLQLGPHKYPQISLYVHVWMHTC